MSAQDLLNAAGKLTVFLEKIEQAKQVLEGAASIENAGREAAEAAKRDKAAAAAAAKQRLTEEQALDEAKAEVAAAKKKGAAAVVAAQTKANDIIGAAEARAAAVTTAAEAQADAARSTLAGLLADCDAAVARRNALLKEAGDAEARLEKIKADAIARFGG